MTRIAQDELQGWASQVLKMLGVRTVDSEHIARCLVDVDLRGVTSHGTRQLKRYVGEFRERRINPALAKSARCVKPKTQSASTAMAVRDIS